MYPLLDRGNMSNRARILWRSPHQLDGDWTAVEGQCFDCWSAKNIVPSFTIPKHWLRFRSMDWGSYSPFSVGWWAVVGEEHKLADGRVLPVGAIVRYREYYGSPNPNSSDKGLKLTAEQVAQGIIEREKDDPKLTYAVLDPSAFKEDGGPSIGHRINQKLIAAKRPAFKKADNTRVDEARSDVWLGRDEELDLLACLTTRASRRACRCYIASTLAG